VAAVTGAASGIGRALAVALARDGVHVALSDLDDAGLDDVVDGLRREGHTADGAVVDVSDASAVDAWARDVAQVHGAVHSIWNVAGIIHSGDVLQSTLADVERIFAVDFWGVVHGTTAFLPRILEAGGGHVVNISSAFGLVSAPSYSAYCAAKFAVRGWTDALRLELRGSGAPVTVTCVYPGAVRTPIMARGTSAAGPEDAERRGHRFERMARVEPEAAAAAIIRGVSAGRLRVLVGRDALAMDALVRLVGGRYETLLPLARRL
jgi:short-subunit dehydrogenase